MKAILAALAVYAAFLPAAVLVHRDYVQLPRPAGRNVEMMLRFHLDPPDRYVSRSYVFGPARYPDTSKIRIYEGMIPVPVDDTQFTADGPVYVVRFKTGDGSDARTNGRQYWIVATD